MKLSPWRLKLSISTSTFVSPDTWVSDRTDVIVPATDRMDVGACLSQLPKVRFSQGVEDALTGSPKKDGGNVLTCYANHRTVETLPDGKVIDLGISLNSAWCLVEACYMLVCAINKQNPFQRFEEVVVPVCDDADYAGALLLSPLGLHDIKMPGIKKADRPTHYLALWRKEDTVPFGVNSVLLLRE